jgi:ABC-type multidrug transport system fused ATPase/permease subunit
MSSGASPPPAGAQNLGRLQEVLRLQETAPRIAIWITEKQLADFLLEVENPEGSKRALRDLQVRTMLKEWKGRHSKLSDQMFKKYGRRPEITTTEIMGDDPAPVWAQVLDRPQFPQLIERLRVGKAPVSQAADPRLASDLLLETKDILCKFSFTDAELSNKAVVILIGQTGSGKSTAGNWLGGQTYCTKTLTNEHVEKNLQLELDADAASDPGSPS